MKIMQFSDDRFWKHYFHWDLFWRPFSVWSDKSKITDRSIFNHLSQNRNRRQYGWNMSVYTHRNSLSPPTKPDRSAATFSSKESKHEWPFKKPLYWRRSWLKFLTSLAVLSSSGAQSKHVISPLDPTAPVWLVQSYEAVLINRTGTSLSV